MARSRSASADAASTTVAAAVRRASPRRFVRRVRVRRPLLAVIVALAASVVQAEEFTTVRSTGWDGYVSTSYFADHLSTSQAPTGNTPGSSSTTTQSDFRVDAFLMTHGYVYHPKFMTFDLGGGPIFQASRLTTDGATDRTQQPLYNLSATATFLADKPYTGKIYYEHLNPTVMLSPGEVFQEETTKAGLAFSLLAPVSPVPFTVELWQLRTQGESTLRSVDDRIDQFTFKGDRAVGTYGNTQIGYQALQQESSSGSLNLPIQNSRLRSQQFNADTSLELGADRNYRVFNSIVYAKNDYTLEQGASPKLDDVRVLLNYRGTHARELQSVGNYNYLRSVQDGRATTVNTMDAGMNWLPVAGSWVSAGVFGRDTRSPDFTLRSYGPEASFNYERRLPFGTATVGYGARYDTRDQRAGTPLTPVVGERVVLRGTSPSNLAQPLVIESSVVVNNAQRTQVYTAGIDYELTVVGVTTRIQRILSGSILDGEEVQVDYVYDVGGTFASTILDQSANLNWRWSNYLNVYLRYYDSRPKVTSGVPSAPLNTIHDLTYGTRVDWPLPFAMEMLVGGYVEREDRSETIAPFVRTESEVYVQSELPFVTNAELRVGMRRTRTVAENELQNVNLTGYDLLLTWRSPLGITLSASGIYERDTGGVDERERRLGKLRALWRFRRLVLTLDVIRSRELQGSFSRDHTSGQLTLRRDF